MKNPARPLRRADFPEAAGILVWALVGGLAWAIAIALALLAGCTVNRLAPAEGFPKLEERVHVLSGKETRDICAPYVPAFWRALGGIPYGCMRVELCEGTCDVWISEHSPGGLAHELEHCRGYDHWFESTMADALAGARRICPERLP